MRGGQAHDWYAHRLDFGGQKYPPLAATCRPILSNCTLECSMFDNSMLRSKSRVVHVKGYSPYPSPRHHWLVNYYLFQSQVLLEKDRFIMYRPSSASEPTLTGFLLSIVNPSASLRSFNWVGNFLIYPLPAAFVERTSVNLQWIASGWLQCLRSDCFPEISRLETLHPDHQCIN